MFRYFGIARLSLNLSLIPIKALEKEFLFSISHSLTAEQGRIEQRKLDLGQRISDEAVDVIEEEYKRVIDCSMSNAHVYVNILQHSMYNRIRRNARYCS